MDLHPRQGKYGHAAIFHLHKQTASHKAVDCMLCNLPASEGGKPALLRHSNVVTFFHEFGHIMHGLCTEGIGNDTRLAKPPRDFVEAPSQMLENWVWQPQVLRRLSKHYETGEPLPEALIASLARAKNVNEGLFLSRQCYLAKLDMVLHGPAPPTDAPALDALVDKLRLEVRGRAPRRALRRNNASQPPPPPSPQLSYMVNPPGANMLRNFGHLAGQYSAGYYGYLWAEVLSADMWSTVFEKDCFCQKAGMRYRKQVLAPGGIGNIADHLAAFLGRPPTQEAFLKSRGIVVADVEVGEAA